MKLLENESKTCPLIEKKIGSYEIQIVRANLELHRGGNDKIIEPQAQTLFNHQYLHIPLTSSHTHQSAELHNQPDAALWYYRDLHNPNSQL